MTPEGMPSGLVLARTTPEFDEHSVPAGLLRTHRIAADVWGQVVVRDGALDLVFEEPPRTVTVTPGAPATLPPDAPHHVELTGPVRFVVEFHRALPA